MTQSSFSIASCALLRVLHFCVESAFKHMTLSCKFSMEEWNVEALASCSESADIVVEFVLCSYSPFSGNLCLLYQVKIEGPSLRDLSRERASPV